MSAAEVLRASGNVAPEWLRKLVWVMDDMIPIPGTGRGVGLDAILGFVLPGAGDALTGLTTFALLVVAVKLDVPGVVIVRMVLQQLVDVLVGSVPIAGDLFDALHRANRSNLELIERHARSGVAPTVADRLWVALAVLVAVGLVAMPFVLTYELVQILRSWIAALAL